MGREVEDLYQVIRHLLGQGRENEWLEFKENYQGPEELGKYVSALANMAAICDKQHGYLVFGVKDDLSVQGTHFHPHKTKAKGNEDLEHWLSQMLNPRIHFSLQETEYEGARLVLLRVSAALHQPVTFMQVSYCRVGSIVRKLSDFPEKEYVIWQKRKSVTFENQVAATGLDQSEALSLIDYEAYFSLVDLKMPTTPNGILERMLRERILTRSEAKYAISHLGAILFAKDLGDFPSLQHKGPRFIVYTGKDKLHTRLDQTGSKGYAVGFKGLVDYVNEHLPMRERIGASLREVERAYPVVAVRELIGNSLIHQDFTQHGAPFIEVYADRIEFSNPGRPLIGPDRFIDEHSSRNETLANLARKLGLCEAKGSGIDRVVHACEEFLLPGPKFTQSEVRTIAVLFAPQAWPDMSKEDRVRACYQHCCLQYVSNLNMTNQSLRIRFGISDANAAIASRIIKEALEAQLIKPEDPNSSSRKFISYIPFWA